MTATPIATGLEQEFDDPDAERDVAKPDGTRPAPDFMADLLDAQMRLITAQHAFLHDADMTALLRAQRDYAEDQIRVLERLGVFG
jgi:hypothetical protein